MKMFLAVLVLSFPVAVSAVGQEEVSQRHYGVSIDLSLTYPQLIAAGKYDATDDRLSGLYWLTMEGQGYREQMILVYPGKPTNAQIMTGEALALLDDLGLRPADLRELLFFGARYPELQRQNSIVALGQTIEYESQGYAPCLTLTERGREVQLLPFGRSWANSVVFLALYK